MGILVEAIMRVLGHEKRLAQHPRRCRPADVVVLLYGGALPDCRHGVAQPPAVGQTLPVGRRMKLVHARMLVVGMHRHRIVRRSGLPLQVAHVHVPVGHKALEPQLPDGIQVEAVHFADPFPEILPCRRAIGSVGLEQRAVELRNRAGIAGIAPFPPFRGEEGDCMAVEIEEMLLLVEAGDADQLRIVNQRLASVRIGGLQQIMQ